ncbi:MAG TPA: hypothetical protein VGH74_15275 [Planctomycetaceae bacterium]
MLFKIDENLPLAVRDALREAGHDACTEPLSGSLWIVEDTRIRVRKGRVV